METIMRGLLSGLIVGVVCVVYVLIRSYRVESELHAAGVQDEERESLASNNWMFMAVLSSASLFWGFIGAGIYRLLESEAVFITLSLILAIAVSTAIFFMDARYKTDKIVLSLIIIAGLGFLIPTLI